MQKNPYPAQSLLGKIFNFLKIKERPVTVTNTAVALGSTYAAVYRAVYNDKIKAVNFEHRDGVRHIALNTEFKNKEPELSINEIIQDVMTRDDSEYGLHVHQIAQKAHETQAEVKAFIKEQVGLGNVEVNPTQGKHGHRYRWAGPINAGIKEEILELAKEVEAETINGTLEPASKDLTELPDAPLAELELPNDTSEPAQEEPTLPETKAMTETTAATTQPLTPKVRYLIQAAKDKMATANSEKSAKRIAKRFVTEGHKRVEISMIYPFAVAKQGVEVERVW